MARVQFVSLHGQDEVDVLDFGLKFRHGEHKEVPDHVAAALLRNPNFVALDAKSAPAAEPQSQETSTTALSTLADAPHFDAFGHDGHESEAN